MSAEGVGLPARGEGGGVGLPAQGGVAGEPDTSRHEDPAESVLLAERCARAALTRAAEPGDVRLGQLLAEQGAQWVYGALCEGRPLPGVGERRLSTWQTRIEEARPEEELAEVAALGGRFLCPGDREWPVQLDDLGEARPVGLWVRGRCSLRFAALRSAAVVGARACSGYGLQVAAQLSAELADRGWCVTSGAAFGVDGAAHRGVLAAEGLTIGVLACGVDRAYPASNGELIARIAERGVLVAELPLGAHPTRSRFLERNRLIAALTRGTVVVEAQVRSGSLVTARRAAELGRYVMGVPGPVTSQLSAGVHRLLREEGELVTSAAEVIELIGDIGELAPRQEGAVLPRDLLHPRCREVLEALPARTAVTALSLSRRLRMVEPEVHARLLELGTLGFVERQGGHWQLTRTCEDHQRVTERSLNCGDSVKR
ncbi:DNA-processing protein DprA [Streptomyces tardus]|uniref:DNA-processing protein DprA n=1 Tax=Streptomyces tardus TaxID=2780544 RepID=UPI003556A82D